MNGDEPVAAADTEVQARSRVARSYRKVAMLFLVCAAAITLVYLQPPDARGEVAETALQVVSAVAVLIVQVNSNEHKGRP
jgi:cytochrome bd-type quinol oxidase subunit 2